MHAGAHSLCHSSDVRTSWMCQNNIFSKALLVRVRVWTVFFISFGSQNGTYMWHEIKWWVKNKSTVAVLLSLKYYMLHVNTVQWFNFIASIFRFLSLSIYMYFTRWLSSFFCPTTVINDKKKKCNLLLLPSEFTYDWVRMNVKLFF